MSLKEAQSLFFRHFEKLAVAGVLIVIIAYLLCLAVGSTEAAQLRAETQTAIEKIELAKENPELPEALSFDFCAQAKKAFAQMPQVGAEPSWFAFKRPYVVRRVIFRTRPRPKHMPVLLAAKADVGQVQLTWQESPQNENVEILRYELYRRKENNPWQLVGRFPQDTNSYLDKGLEHEQEYEYKLLSFARALSGTAPFADPLDSRKESKPQRLITRFNLELTILGSGEGKIIVVVEVLQAGNKSNKYTRRLIKGSQVLDTGWVVEDFKENSITIKKGNTRKTFNK